MADITQGTSDEILFLSSGRPVRDIIELKLDDPSVTCLGSATTTGRQCCPPNQSALDEVALILYDAEESGHILKSQLNDLARLVLCKRINSSLRQTLVDSWAQDIQLDNEASISACPAKVAHGNRAHSIAVPGSHAGVVNLRNHEAANTQAQRHRNALEEKYLIHRLIFLNLNPGSPRSRAMPSCIRQHPYEQLIRMPAVPTAIGLPAQSLVDVVSLMLSFMDIHGGPESRAAMSLQTLELRHISPRMRQSTDPANFQDPLAAALAAFEDQRTMEETLLYAFALLHLGPVVRYAVEQYESLLSARESFARYARAYNGGVRRLQFEEEVNCAICSEPLVSATPQHRFEVVWCRSQCGHNLHRRCMQLWAQRRSQSSEPPNCPHW